jgi:hypothetical protein
VNTEPTMTAADCTPGSVWVDRATHKRLAWIDQFYADTGTVILPENGPVGIRRELTVDELLADWESVTVLTPVGSKWTTTLVYMPSVVTEVNHATGECLRQCIGDPDDCSWDECWKVHDLFRRIGGRS